jgi:hypothetical protein
MWVFLAYAYAVEISLQHATPLSIARRFGDDAIAHTSWPTPGQPHAAGSSGELPCPYSDIAQNGHLRIS